MGESRLVVNHRVALSGSKDHAAVSGSRLLYIANRPGSVAEPSEDDERIKIENERMVRLGYINFRPGSVSERNRGHALFDQSGIPERAKIAAELKAAPGAVITSVVSVRRSDAKALGLEDKQSWERFLRAHWADHIAEAGAMGRHDVRWVAAFHTNQKRNLHCHVFTWDASGNFNSLLPRKQMAAAVSHLQQQAAPTAVPRETACELLTEGDVAALRERWAARPRNTPQPRNVGKPTDKQGSTAEMKYGYSHVCSPAERRALRAVGEQTASTLPTESVAALRSGGVCDGKAMEKLRRLPVIEEATGGASLTSAALKGVASMALAGAKGDSGDEFGREALSLLLKLSACAAASGMSSSQRRHRKPRPSRKRRQVMREDAHVK